MPNVGLQLMTLRFRVICSTDYASQAPLFSLLLDQIFFFILLYLLCWLLVITLFVILVFDLEFIIFIFITVYIQVTLY